MDPRQRGLDLGPYSRLIQEPGCPKRMFRSHHRYAKFPSQTARGHAVRVDEVRVDHVKGPLLVETTCQREQVREGEVGVERMGVVFDRPGNAREINLDRTP